MIDIDVKLSGDMMGALDGFAKDVEDKVIFSGVAAMAKVIYNEVKLNTSGANVRKAEKNFVGPRQDAGPPGKVTGTLDKAIYRVYSPEKSSQGVKTYKVSVNKAKAPHWFLVEFGSSRAPAHPYIRPAFDHIQEAIKAGQSRMSERIDEVIAAKAGGS